MVRIRFGLVMLSLVGSSLATPISGQLLGEHARESQGILERDALMEPHQESLLAKIKTTSIAIDGPWYEFSFEAVGLAAAGCLPDDPAGLNCGPGPAENSVFAGPPPWIFTVTQGEVRLEVTDAFVSADAFEVFDFGVSIGATPAVGTGGFCGDDPLDPASCFADPLLSSGAFPLSAGMHSITITPTVIHPLGGGVAFFRATGIIFTDGFESGNTSQWSDTVP